MRRRCQACLAIFSRDFEYFLSHNLSIKCFLSCTLENTVVEKINYAHYGGIILKVCCSYIVVFERFFGSGFVRQDIVACIYKNLRQYPQSVPCVMLRLKKNSISMERFYYMPRRQSLREVIPLHQEKSSTLIFESQQRSPHLIYRIKSCQLHNLKNRWPC